MGNQSRWSPEFDAVHCMIMVRARYSWKIAGEQNNDIEQVRLKNFNTGGFC